MTEKKRTELTSRSRNAIVYRSLENFISYIGRRIIGWEFSKAYDTDKPVDDEEFKGLYDSLDRRILEADNREFLNREQQNYLMSVSKELYSFYLFWNKNSNLPLPYSDLTSLNPSPFSTS